MRNMELSAAWRRRCPRSAPSVGTEVIDRQTARAAFSNEGERLAEDVRLDPPRVLPASDVALGTMPQDLQRNGVAGLFRNPILWNVGEPVEFTKNDLVLLLRR